MKTLKLSIYAFLLLALNVSCSDDKLNKNTVFVDRESPKNALDNYIYNTYTKPYNIAVLYKYVDKETLLRYHLVPAHYDGSVRLTKLLHHLVIEPYNELTGSKDFMRNNFARLITYIGSVAVQNNGTVILGTAETGSKIALFNVLDLDEEAGKDFGYLNFYYLKTMHHEFQHILNQKKPFPKTFDMISGPNYVADSWNTFWTGNQNLGAGFITKYASKDAIEDFAELYSVYVTNSQHDLDSLISVAGSTEAGRNVINAKLTVVKNYMSTSWGIDMDRLRTIIQGRYATLESFDQTTLH